VAGATKVERI